MSKTDDATAEAPKMTAKDRETRLKDLRRRNKQVHQDDPNSIARNELIRTGAGVFDDEKFLLGEIDRLRRLLGRRATEEPTEAAAETDD